MVPVAAPKSCCVPLRKLEVTEKPPRGIPGRLYLPLMSVS
jgi:hypothetical protein